MKISVIIPMYNAEKYLGVCLESLLIQTFQDFEVIVVDDCSTDNSCAVAESYLERFGGRLKIISLEENTGSGAVPRNVGFEHARGKYIYFMDNDDLLIDIALETLYNYAEKNLATIVCMSKYFSCDEELVPKNLTAQTWGADFIPDEAFFEPYDLTQRVEKIMRFSFIWAPWGKFLRRDFLIDNGIKFLPMTIAEDVIWTLELTCLAKNFLRISEPLYVYRENKSSIMRRTQTPKQMIIFRTNPLIKGIDYLEEFMRGQEFFRENPMLKLKILDFFACINLGNITEAMKYLNPIEAYEVILREFSKAESTQPALISYLLVMNNLYRNELAK